jgi:hypothetical protein
VAIEQLGFPYDLVFEGPNLTSIELVRAGQNPYDPAIYAAPPFLLTMYTPLYHYLVAALPAHPENPFLTGRWVACIAMLTAAGGLFLVAGRRTPPTLALFAFGVFFAIWPVSLNTFFLKNDPLALAFSVGAVLAVHHGRGRRGMPAVCALLGLAAIGSKQSFVAAWLACALHLLVVDRRQATQLLAWSLGLGLALALAAQWIWGSGFWFSTIGAVRQQITLDHAGRIAWRIARQPIVPGLLVLTAAVSWDALRSQGREALQRSPYLVYVLSSGTVLLLSVGKLGSSTNYVMEFALAQLLWTVYQVGPRWPDWVRSHALVAAVFAICCVAEFQISERSNYAFPALAIRDQIGTRIGELRRELEALGYDEPLLLIPNTHRLGPALTARPTLNDPLLYRLLWRDGILDLDDMIASIDAQVYDVIMLPISDRSLDPLTPRGLLSAIDRSYEVARASAGQRFFVRRARTPDS